MQWQPVMVNECRRQKVTRSEFYIVFLASRYIKRARSRVLSRFISSVEKLSPASCYNSKVDWSFKFSSLAVILTVTTSRVLTLLCLAYLTQNAFICGGITVRRKDRPNDKIKVKVPNTVCEQHTAVDERVGKCRRVTWLTVFLITVFVNERNHSQKRWHRLATPI